MGEYEGLSKQDVFACLLFATNTIENSAFFPW